MAEFQYPSWESVISSPDFQSFSSELQDKAAEKHFRNVGFNRRDVETEAERLAKRNNIDPEFVKNVIYTESGWNPNAVSPAGAVGLGQLMPAAAHEMQVKDRRDFLQNLRGSIGYLAKQVGRFGGDLKLAAGAYNMGPGAMANHLRIWKELNLDELPRETREYIRKVTGLKKELGREATIADVPYGSMRGKGWEVGKPRKIQRVENAPKMEYSNTEGYYTGDIPVIHGKVDQYGIPEEKPEGGFDIRLHPLLPENAPTSFDEEIAGPPEYAPSFPRRALATTVGVASQFSPFTGGIGNAVAQKIRDPYDDIDKREVAAAQATSFIPGGGGILRGAFTGVISNFVDDMIRRGELPTEMEGLESGAIGALVGGLVKKYAPVLAPYSNSIKQYIVSKFKLPTIPSSLEGLWGGEGVSQYRGNKGGANSQQLPPKILEETLTAEKSQKPYFSPLPKDRFVPKNPPPPIEEVSGEVLPPPSPTPSTFEGRTSNIPTPPPTNTPQLGKPLPAHESPPPQLEYNPSSQSIEKGKEVNKWKKENINPTPIDEPYLEPGKVESGIQWDDIPPPEPFPLSTRPTPKEEGSSKVKEMIRQYGIKGQQNDYVEHTISQLDDAGVNPQDIVKQFWKETYPKLPQEGKKQIEKQVRGLTSVKPGEGQTWEDVFYSGIELPSDVSLLEGREKGLVALMYEANKKVLRIPPPVGYWDSPPPPTIREDEYINPLEKVKRDLLKEQQPPKKRGRPSGTKTVVKKSLKNDPLVEDIIRKTREGYVPPETTNPNRDLEYLLIQKKQIEDQRSTANKTNVRVN